VRESSALGYVDRTTLTSLAAGVQVGASYLWRVIAKLPDGALAIPFYFYRITFASRSFVNEIERVPSNAVAP
jgi:hypothetical protein